jgi:hypothetical protein
MMQEQYTLTLYRPVGLIEAELILKSDARVFPPRLPEQPIFYPVLTPEYAHQIARDWNTRDERSGFAGFVTRFEVDKEYANRFEVQTVGASSHQELWVPAEELAAFNLHIRGRINFIGAYYGSGYKGPKHWYKEWHADELFWSLYTQRVSGAAMDLNGEVFMNRDAILLNFKYWAQQPYSVSPDGRLLTEDEKKRFLQEIALRWKDKFADWTLPGSELVEDG